MSYRPRTAIRQCPGCGQGKQFVRLRGFFSCDVRLECPCGVAGQWHDFSDDESCDRWRAAAIGWADAFGEPNLPRPPPPMGMPVRSSGWSGRWGAQ